MTRRLIRVLLCATLASCGSTSAPPAAPPAPTSTPRTDDNAVAIARAEDAHKQELAVEHNKRLDEQATALAATCDKPAEAPPRCLPSCYEAEPADPRAGKPVAGVAQIGHLVCTTDPAQGPFAIADEVAGGKLDLRTLRGRIPKAGKKGSWQAAVEEAATTALEPDLARGDAIRVIGAWKSMRHPISKQRLRCVTIAHYAKAQRKLDACGSRGAVACEASGNAAAHGINVVHYRLFEAKRFHAAHDDPKCQQAALEAVAVARGLPRWRQYVKLNTNQWKESPRYRTRFDGVLDEDTLFQAAIDLGTMAQHVYESCGGSTSPSTTADDEQSFHTCP